MSLSLLAFSLSFPSVIYTPSEGSLKNERTSLSSGTSAIIVPYYMYITCALTTLSPLSQPCSTNTFLKPSKHYPDCTGPH